MDAIRRTEAAPGYEILEIDHPRCRARVALHGAHVMEWQPTGENPVLYCSPQSVFQPGKAIRGGIPLCWPWFNAHPSDPSKPSHGIARNRFWRLLDAQEAPDEVVLLFALEDDDATRALWPFAFHAELEVRLGTQLEVILTSHNRSDQPMPVSGALHSYLAVADIGKVRVEGLEAAPFTDTVGGRRECPASGEAIHFTGEVDRIYHHRGETVVVDGGRRLRIAKEGSPSTVVWNPWAEKAAALADLPDSGYRDFVCVEAAIANDHAALVPPGGSHRLATRIEVDRP